MADQSLSFAFLDAFDIPIHVGETFEIDGYEITIIEIDDEGERVSYGAEELDAGGSSLWP